jgi:hypothetical protein
VTNPFVRFGIRWWWARWHPLVRMGWNTLQSSSRGANVQTLFGGVLIGLGLIMRSRRRDRLYADVVPEGGEFRIRVVEVPRARSGT